jgi:type VI protein secretion system component VasK
MRIDHIAEVAIRHLLGRVFLRGLAAVVGAIFALAAIYHFTAAGLLVLEAQYGTLNARLAIGALFSAAALITIAVLWATRFKSRTEKRVATPREQQLAMLIDAVMVGYARSRKRR